MGRWIIAGAMAFMPGATAQAANAGKSAVDATAPIEAVGIHRLFAGFFSFSCSEHYAGELPYLGDDLGSDCIVMR